MRIKNLYQILIIYVTIYFSNKNIIKHIKTILVESIDLAKT